MPKTILITDDNEHLRHILSTILRYEGYQILEAATGAEAVEKAISSKPDLILLDFQLPDMTGADAARKIRKHPRCSHIPLIGWSAYLNIDYRKAALDSGMIDYLQKPVSADLIKTKIRRILNQTPAAA